MLRNTHHDIRNTNHIRCDNCFFSAYIIGQCRSVLTCRQKTNFEGRWWIVALDDKCPNFYPSSTFKAGKNATRRIPLTQGKFALVDAVDYYRLVKFQWYAAAASNTFYVVRKHAGKPLKMHRQIMDAPSHLVVDHIDHNGLNNTRANLRLCTFAQNLCNALPPANASSRYKGVSWEKRRKNWRVVIQFNNKTYHLGHFENEIDAAKAYDKRAIKLHGEFACLNFPPVASKL